jgi:rRNA-processing protein FCF1
MEIYNDEQGSAFPIPTVGTEIEEADIMVQNTVVVELKEVKKRGRKPGKSIAKKRK